MIIGEHAIPSSRVFVIAEVGSNHEGDLNKAKEHIQAAKEAGAHAVKFQSLNVHKLYNSPATEISRLHSLIDLEEEWHYELNEYSKQNNIHFSSSATYLDALKILANIPVSFLKIASAQVATFPQIIEAAGETGIPLMMSTGISTYEDISRSIACLKRNKNSSYAILHCNSQYPTPYTKVHLGMIEIYKRMFLCPVGYSDHTIGTSVVLGAVARGADIIEKHFKLDQHCDTPDSPFSITPQEFSKMTSDIRNVEDACLIGSRTSIDKDEASFKEKIRYKLILNCCKKEGESFKRDDFSYLRDPRGIDVSYEKLVIDNFKTASQLTTGSILEWRDIRGQ